MACSGYEICFEIPGIGKSCICVPLLIDPNWRLKRPDPLGRAFIDIRVLNRDQIRHIQVLASISDLASELPGDLGREIQKGVTTQIQAFNAKLGGAMQISEHKGGQTGS